VHEALNRPDDAKRSLMKVLADNPNFDPARKRLAALGGIVPLLPVNAEAAVKQVDDIQTGSVTPDPDSASGGTTTEPTPAVAPPPKLLVGAVQNVDANQQGDDAVAQTTINIAPRPGKAYVDRIPVEEDKPAGMQKPVAADAAEKVIAVEAVPDDEPAVAAVAPAPDKIQKKAKPQKVAATEANTASDNDQSTPLTGWSVQISSQKNEQVAWSVWKKLKAKHSILAEQKPVVMKADLGDRGIVYRLRLAGFDDQNSARDLCSKLKSRGVSCYVSRLDS
jgi:sporulation related protein